jgi:hypothetical protein
VKTDRRGRSQQGGAGRGGGGKGHAQAQGGQGEGGQSVRTLLAANTNLGQHFLRNPAVVDK